MYCILQHVFYFYTLRILKMVQNGILTNKDIAYSSSGLIAEAIEIPAIIRARDKFGLKVALNCVQIKFISNSGCHAPAHGNPLFF